jgi:hypothetical protein
VDVELDDQRLEVVLDEELSVVAPDHVPADAPEALD